MAANNNNPMFAQSQQQWEYQQGGARMQVQMTGQSWSSQGQAGVTASTHQVPMLSMPAIQATSMQNVHQQMHANAMAHHQSAMQQHFNTMQGMMQPSMNSMFLQQQLPHPQIGSMQFLPQQQMQLPAPPAQLVIEEMSSSSEEDSEDSSEESSSDDEADQMVLYQQQQDIHRQALEERLAAEQKHRDAQLRMAEKKYTADQQHMQRQGAIMDNRLRKLEDRETKNHAEQEIKDREMRQLRAENDRLKQQRLGDSEKHRSEMAELARMQASRPQEPATVFDTAALEKVIREVQAQQLSKSDIEKVIQERVASQLDGLAKKKDIEAAGSVMQKALNQMPTGMSANQVQQVVTQQLTMAVDTLASKVQSQRPKIENVPIAQPPALQSQRPRIENVPVARPPALQTANASSSKSSTMMSHLSGALVKSGKSKVKSEQQPVMMPEKTVAAPMQTPAQAAPQVSNAADDATTLPGSALMKIRKPRKSSRSVISVQPSAINALVIGASQPGGASAARSQDVNTSSIAVPTALEPSTFGQALVKRSKHKKDSSVVGVSNQDSSLVGVNNQLSLPNSHNTELPDDLPDTASQFSTWQRSKTSKSSKKALPSIEESQAQDCALMKIPKRGKEHAASAAGPLVKQSKVDKTSTPTMHVTLADIPSHMSNMPMPAFGQNQQFTLPDDLPDNVSQLSAWERKRGSALTDFAALPQVAAPAGSQAVVKSSKPKKHGK